MSWRTQPAAERGRRPSGSGGMRRGSLAGGGSGPRAVVLPSLRHSTGASGAGQVSPQAASSPSALRAAKQHEEYAELVADHAWVDEEGEMDYDFVPFSDDTTSLQLLESISSAAGSESRLIDSAGGVEEDPVLRALRLRKEREEEEAKKKSRSGEAGEQRRREEAGRKETAMTQQKKREEEAVSARVTSLKEPVATLPPATTAPPVVRSWRDAAKPVVAPAEVELPRTYTRPAPPVGSISIAQRPISEASPKMSGLDVLINSIRSAAKSHAAANSQAAVPAKAKAPPEAQAPAIPVVEYLQVPPPAGKIHTRATERSLVIRMEPGRAPVHTRFTVHVRQEGTGVWKPYIDLSRISLSALRPVHSSSRKRST